MMETKTTREIEKRLNKMPDLTKEQIRKLEERIKKHKENHGTLEHQGLVKRLVKHFF